MAKYLATSLAMEKVVSEPRVMSSCLPISTTSISLVGLESRSTMLPASLAAVVPVFMATPTSAWARAGASFVPSPVMATSLPPSCSALMSSILFSGVASARKSSTPASWAMAAAVSGLSPVIITVRMPGGAQLGEPLLDPGLDDVLELDDPEHLGTVGHHERGGSGPGDAVDEVVEAVGHGAALLDHPVAHRFGRTLADLAAVDVETRHAGRGRERDELVGTPRVRARGCRSAPWPARRSSAPRASRRPAKPAARRRPPPPRCGRRPGRSPTPCGCRA